MTPSPVKQAVPRKVVDVPLLRPGTNDLPWRNGTACPAEAVPDANWTRISAGQADGTNNYYPVTTF
jgi:hypothetical protein